MQANKKNLIYILIFYFLTGCIDSFTPDIDEYRQLLVIHGEITDREGEHIVTVSRSSPLDNPQYVPEQGCTVEVIDDKGNSLEYAEYIPVTLTRNFWLQATNTN